MKIAFTTNTDGKDGNSPLDPRFGRAAGFLIYDTDRKSWGFHDNRQNLEAAQGAGIQSARNIAELGVAAVVTGHCGPKAFQVLGAAGIAIHLCDAKTCGDALSKYLAGSLPASEAADVEGHW
jgi:predicted Fe-Mo cluster-binding NifX family protein